MMGVGIHSITFNYAYNKQSRKVKTFLNDLNDRLDNYIS